MKRSSQILFTALALSLLSCSQTLKNRSIASSTRVFELNIISSNLPSSRNLDADDFEASLEGSCYRDRLIEKPFSPGSLVPCGKFKSKTKSFENGELRVDYRRSKFSTLNGDNIMYSLKLNGPGINNHEYVLGSRSQITESDRNINVIEQEIPRKIKLKIKNSELLKGMQNNPNFKYSDNIYIIDYSLRILIGNAYRFLYDKKSEDIVLGKKIFLGPNVNDCKIECELSFEKDISQWVTGGIEDHKDLKYSFEVVFGRARIKGGKEDDRKFGVYSVTLDLGKGLLSDNPFRNNLHDKTLVVDIKTGVATLE